MSKKQPKSVAAALALAESEAEEDESGASNPMDRWSDLIKSGKLAAITRHLDRDASSVDAQAGMLGPTALHVAVATGRADVCALLIKRGANLNVRHLGRGGVSPLHTAAYYDAVDVVELLLVSGADPLVRSHAGLLPIDVADADAECRAALQKATDKALKALAKKVAAVDVKALLAAAPKSTVLVAPNAPAAGSAAAAAADKSDDDDDDSGSGSAAENEPNDAVARFLRGDSEPAVPVVPVPAAAAPEPEKAKKHKKKSSRRRKSSEDNECVVCMEHERETAIQPCGHVALCTACAASVLACPICNGPKDGVIKLFHV